VVKSIPALALALTLLAPPWTSFASGEHPDVAVMTKRCGEVVMSITCPSDGHGKLNCLKTSLTLKTKDGQTQRLTNPKGMEDYTATGLTCSASKVNKASYFVVGYGELPSGCEFCEWYHLYDAKGTSLTSSSPPLLENPNGPPAQNMAPNNKEFDALNAKLGLGKFTVNYLTCDGTTSDSKGNAICFKER